ncbi:MAG: hypothetical protein MJ127_02900 [Mogibacterium sp.]|nr:hypothetical protein [Mogibacterium sp.]
MNYEYKCNFVYQLRAQLCDEVEAEEGALTIRRNGETLDFGNIKTGNNIYACLVYDHCRVITFVTDGRDSEVINLIFSSDGEYDATLALLSNVCNIPISVQDGKLISYARSISEKLRSGISVSVFDSVKEDDFIICSACGVQNAKDSGFPFCLECGEPL